MNIYNFLDLCELEISPLLEQKRALICSPGFSRLKFCHPKGKAWAEKRNLKYLWLKKDYSLGINTGFVLENWDNRSDYMHMRKKHTWHIFPNLNLTTFFNQVLIMKWFKILPDEKSIYLKNYQLIKNLFRF